MLVSTWQHCEDLFTAGRAGTARKGGRASTGGLKVRSVWGRGGGVARTEQLRAQYTAGKGGALV